jgi:hypothetical protein
MVGNRTDAADGAGSLHAKIGDIKNKLGTSSDTRASNTVMGMSSTQIKSIQRGSLLLDNFNTNSGVTAATISSVNTGKSVLIFSVRTGQLSAVSQVTGVITSGTSIQFTNMSYQNTNWVAATAEWQVIEYY